LVTEQTAPPATGDAPATPPVNRGRKTVADMVRSLAVVLVLVAVIVAFNVAEQPDRVVQKVDYPAALAEARAVATYDVLGPDPVPDGWRVTSARTERSGGGVGWHVGLVTSTEEYAALEQSDGDRRALLDTVVGGARQAGSVEVAGLSWRRLVGGEPEERALVRTADGVTAMVVGSAPWSQLRTLAGSLAG
jgi:hypothetical protein